MNDADYMKLALDHTKLAQAHIAPTLIVGELCVVFIVSEDPNPSVTGKGIRLLRVAGIKVITDLSKEEADVSNRAFIQHNYTCVNLKAAATLDSRLTMHIGNSKWNTSENTRLDLHTLRDTHDAFLVGVNTNLQDIPFLTTRLPHGGKNPIRFIFNRHLRTPKAANFIKYQAVESISFTRESNGMHALPYTPFIHVESIPKMTGGVN